MIHGLLRKTKRVGDARFGDWLACSGVPRNRRAVSRDRDGDGPGTDDRAPYLFSLGAAAQPVDARDAPAILRSSLFRPL